MYNEDCVRMLILKAFKLPQMSQSEWVRSFLKSVFASLNSSFLFCTALAYRCLHGSAPPYLAETLHLTSDIEACRRLRSGSTSTLAMPATRRSSLGDRAFPVAAVRAWNTLPVSLRTVSSFLTFRHELKTFLLNISFPDTEPRLTL